MLAPLLAAAGAFVPMISGRGLGHSGGTLDKLEAIPGWRAELDPTAFARIVREEGAAIVAASPDIAPADRRLYSIRDVTGTVESIDLITASILSKKLAAGIGGLVLDVKAGSGAFMKTYAEAEILARALVETAVWAGCPTIALITGMEEPLAPALGNALEVAEAMAVLEGAAGPLRDVTLALGAEALVLAGLAAPAEAEDRLTRLLSSGAALERFGRMVAAQGGPRNFTTRWREMLPVAPVVAPVFPLASGIMSGVKGAELGRIVVELGGGRRYLGIGSTLRWACPPSRGSEHGSARRCRSPCFTRRTRRLGKGRRRHCAQPSYWAGTRPRLHGYWDGSHDTRLSDRDGQRRLRRCAGRRRFR